ncbi:MAG: hypothetical protein AAGE52_06675 [Myxococcota bacterium]
MEAEIVRLEELRASLGTDERRVRWFLLGIPASIVLGFAVGALWFWLTFLLTLSFLATAAYLLRVRRNEYTDEIATVRRDMKKL